MKNFDQFVWATRLTSYRAPGSMHNMDAPVVKIPGRESEVKCQCYLRDVQRVLSEGGFIRYVWQTGRSTENKDLVIEWRIFAK